MPHAYTRILVLPLSRRTAMRLGAGSIATLTATLDGRSTSSHPAATQGATLAATPTVPGQTVALNGADIYYVVYGNGDPVVLVHGGFAHGGAFSHQIPALADAGYQVIVIDSRGHGHSSHGQQPLTYELMASDVLGVMDHLGIEKADLVGWSDGAIIGLELAIHNPERLTKVVAYGANFVPEGIHDATPTPEVDAIFNAFFGQMAADYEQFAPDPHEMDVLGDELTKLYKAAPNFTEDQLRSIPTPFLILDGAEEELISPDQPERLAEWIPNATLILMPDVGHFAPVQQPEEFNRIVLEYLGS
jgi:pimeloyl-ACP methyl ester carboxylesterase